MEKMLIMKKRVRCPVIRVDGMKSLKENVELLVAALSKERY